MNRIIPRMDFYWIVFILLFSLIPVSICWAGDDPLPLKDTFEINQKITKTGEIIIFNGWQPNLRMIIEKNKIIGIGKTEADYESSVPLVLRKYIENEYEIEATVILEYIGNVSIIYYENPLPCFKINEISKLRAKKFGKDNWEIVK